MRDRICERVANAIMSRSIKGYDKYGTTMDRNDLSLLEWLQHLQEEVMDAAVYIEKLKQEIHYQESISIHDPWPEWDEDSRISDYPESNLTDEEFNRSQ